MTSRNDCSQCSPQIECETRGHVRIWWFPRDFSQSWFGGRDTGSNPCTLIALLVAQRCYQQEIKIWDHEEQSLNTQLISALADSIVEGRKY